MSIYKILAAPTQVPQSKTGGRVAMSNSSSDFSGENYSQLIEDLVFLIRQSCYIQLARVDAYLDGVVLAAEQVQDVRIRLQETKSEVTSWGQFFFDILLIGALESTVAGKVITKLTKLIFTPILRQNIIFMALPKSVDGVTLKRRAERLARMNAPDRGSFLKIRNNILQQGVGGPGLEALGRKGKEKEEIIKLYHASLEALIQGTEAAQTNLVAAAKAINEGRTRAKPTPVLSLGATDSAGVAILAAAQHYASLTRLGIQVRHARFEALVRGQKVMPADLAPIIDAFGWEEIELDLNDIRCRYMLLFEAVIWARLYGFDYEQKTPRLYAIAGEFDGIPKNLSDYWLNRFGSSVDAWNETLPDNKKYKGLFYNLSPMEQMKELQGYFWEIAKKKPHILEGQLSQRKP